MMTRQEEEQERPEVTTLEMKMKVQQKMMAVVMMLKEPMQRMMKEQGEETMFWKHRELLVKMKVKCVENHQEEGRYEKDLL